MDPGPVARARGPDRVKSRLVLLIDFLICDMNIWVFLMANRPSVENEIADIERDLDRELERLLLEHSNLVRSAVRDAERKLLPLRAYLAALDGESPLLGSAPKQESALSRLLAVLQSNPHGMHRRDLDAHITASGLTLASARKARYLAEGQGLAARTGATWTLTAAGRVQAGGQ